MDNKNSNKKSILKNDSNKEKLNNNEILRRIQLRDNDYFMLFVGLAIILLVLIFIYNEYRQSKKNKIVSEYTNDYEILLDSKNNKLSPYHFKQAFGSYKNEDMVNLVKFTLYYDNTVLEFDNYEDANRYKITNNIEDIKIIRKNIDILSIDKKFDFLENEDCDNIKTKISIFFNIKFPYVYSNKGWKTSYRNNKPILQIGKSPIIHYNPYNNYLEIGIAYKGKSVFRKMKYIRIENILLKTWLNIYFVIDNRKIKIYQNKELIKYEVLDSVPILDIDKNATVKFGEYNNNFNGLVNKIIFYRKALSTSEIKNL